MLKATAAAIVAINISACASAGDLQVRGNYYWGHEVESFRPCGSEKSFWVVGSDSVLKPLRDKAKLLARAAGKPYQAVYVEAFATREAKAEDGFAADYEGIYRFTGVRVVSASSPNNCKHMANNSFKPNPLRGSA
jgi:hypothetical protein